MINKSIFTISLDFELYWGIRDRKNLLDSQKQLKNIKDIVYKILELFAEYDVHATWACVGFLFFNKKSELKLNLPRIKPTYADSNLSPYPYIEHTDLDGYQDIHFAPDILQQIQRQPGQEIASHTFSHHYCLEAGQTALQFEWDIKHAVKTARRHGITLKSIVFPRNQVNPNYIDILKKYGITSFRSNPLHWIYTNKNKDNFLIIRRLFRFIDSYINVSGQNCYNNLNSNKTLLNIPYSYYLRPVSGQSKYFQPLQLHRLKTAMHHAAVHEKLFHLWWHPHNFANYPDLNLKNLKAILSTYKCLSKKYNMCSMNMHELSSTFGV